MKKVAVYVLVVVLCVGAVCSGVFCGISWFKKAHAESHIIGQLNINNSYTMDTFSYSNAKHPICFYHDDDDATDFWYFKEELEKVSSFDGTKKQYEITLNNYIILEPTILFRAVSFRVPIVFKDLDSSVSCDTYFDITIKFYNDKTNFEVTATGDRNRQFIERYIEANGFELFVKEVTK